MSMQELKAEVLEIFKEYPHRGFATWDVWRELKKRNKDYITINVQDAILYLFDDGDVDILDRQYVLAKPYSVTEQTYPEKQHYSFDVTPNWTIAAPTVGQLEVMFNAR